MKKNVVIVGGGQATVSLLSKLRTIDFDYSITVICEEDFLPYQRPPLSKAYLLDKINLERLFLKQENYYKEKNIDLRLGTKVTSIDRNKNSVLLGSEKISYDILILATGAKPNELPKRITSGVENIFSIRNIHDVNQLKKKFSEARVVLIIGGGYIGLEAAAVCAEKGLKVRLVESAERILQRVACKETSNYLKDVHISKGVEICEKISVATIRNQGEKILAIFSDGSSFDCDFVITGIGASPEIFLAEESGLKIENGIWTNSKGLTSDENIWAVGDCASFPLNGENIRLESVGHAIDHAETIAQNLTGANISYNPKPWFWSDQYNIKLQIAGLNSGFTEIIERKNDANSVSFWYYKENNLLAVDAINAPKDYMIGKRLIETKISPKKEIVKDPTNNLKDLIS